MERVLKQASLKSSIVLFLLFLGSAQSSFATTVIIPSDDDMVIGARAILRGKVVAVESSFDERSSRIYTYITVKVREVLKGQIAEHKIVLKELGGQVGDKISVIYGNPRFKKGEQVLLYLDTWADGSLRTYQMFLGKFNIVSDPITGKETAVRSSPDENTTVLQHQLHGHGTPGHSTERQKLSAYTRMVRDRLAANWDRSVRFEAEAHGSIPVVAEPPEYRSIAREDLNPQFTFLGPFRFFEPDSGQPVSFSLNPDPSSQQGVPQVTLNSADVAAAGNAWSNVTGSALTMSFSGAMNECYAGTGIPGVHVVSNNCDGRNGATSGCAGILAWGGVSQTGFQTRTINGTTFGQTTQGFISMNPWASCHFTINCNVQEILTHEIGHAIGLGHSQFSDATMAAFAHFDGRCASIRADDTDGLKAIYPGTGGPGPLTITTSTLANGTTGSTYSQTLQASGGTSPYSWSIVSGLGNLPPGLGLNPGSGVISGTATTTGTYNFTVRVTDSVAATAQKALSIVVTQPGIAYNSQFVSQTVPTTLQPDQDFTVNMKFLNTGTQTWSGSAYYFASQNPPLNQTWGGNGVPLLGFTAAPGEQLDVTFIATAPTTPGTYNFQWQLYKDNGTAFFGQMSTNVVINVGNQPVYEGYHDSADCQAISGWAWDKNQPNSSISVDIYDGTTLIATVTASAFRQDLLNAGKGNGVHGFSFATPASLKNGQPHSIRVKFSGTSNDLPGTLKTITCGGSYHGYQDWADCQLIGGWAWDSNQPNSPINVDIYDGTTLIATVAANQFRQDLLNAGIGNGSHAFSFATPASLKNGQPHSIRVKFSGTGTDFATPKTITCAGYQGYRDWADCQLIGGWAWDSTQPNIAINVDIYDGTTLIATVAANQFRQDLLNAGKGNGVHGFTFATPASLKDGQPHSIRVKFSGTGTDFAATKTITCGGP